MICQRGRGGVIPGRHIGSLRFSDYRYRLWGEIAQALYRIDGLDLSADEVARVLHASEGLDLSVGRVARALYLPEGLGLDKTLETLP